MAEWYEWGDAKTTPHIHAYNNGFHLKSADGTRYDMVKGNRRVPQAKLNEAFDAVRADYPLVDDTRRTRLLQKMKDLLRNVAQHHDDIHVPKT